jgi:lipopolysaccharide exporter
MGEKSYILSDEVEDRSGNQPEVHHRPMDNKNRTVPNGDNNLGLRVVKGGMWVFSLRIIDQILYIIRLTILARLLAEYDFGLMGIAMLTMATLETFTRTGFREALIQKKEHAEDYLDSAWTILLVRGILLFACVYFLAPAAAVFFKAPEALLIIRVFGLSLLFRSLTNVGVVFFQKELEFNKQFLYEITGILTNFVVMVLLAIWLRNAWALVLGFLARQFVQMVVSYIIHPYRPRLRFEPGQIKELFGFGKWIFGSSVLVFLVTQGDDILVGRILGAAMLGFYQLAFKISNTPTTEISYNIAVITFPAYAKLQDNVAKLRQAYLRFLQVVSVLSFPLAALIVALAPEFVLLFLGAKWMPMVPAMQILALTGLVRALINTTDPLFHGVGKPGIETRWQLVRLMILAALIYPLTSRWGIEGASAAVLLSLFLSNFGFARDAIRVSGCGLGGYMKMVSVPLVGGAAAAAAIFGLKGILSVGLFEFVLLGAAGCAVYLVVLFAAERLFGYRIFGLIREQWFALRRA